MKVEIKMSVPYILIIMTILIIQSQGNILVIQGNSLNYQELSKKYVYSDYNNIDDSILSNSSKPGELYKLRKSLLSTRSYLDIFCYAYSDAQPDLFLILRESLNKGYTDIGNFDDLQHVNATDKDIEKLLSKCLKWKYEFSNIRDKYNMKSYLNNVGSTLFYRNKNNLSKDFWGNVDEIPNNTLTGYQNIGLLSGGQINNCLNNYEYVMKLVNIWEPQLHEQFHDYRKLIRSVMFIPSFFSEVYTGSTDKYVSILSQSYNNFGKINDKINEYEYYSKKGDNRTADRKKDEIISMWSKLRNWMSDNNYTNVLKNLYNLIA